MHHDFDLFVIGGGSGGVRAARLAAETGARVGLAEQAHYGGTCVARGCVPKKLMTYAAGYAQLHREAEAYGWMIERARFEWPRFRRNLQSELQRLGTLYRKRLLDAGVQLFDQRARLTGTQRIALADGSELSAREVLIATGAHARRPQIPGADLAWISDDVFTLDTLPESLLIVGGGYIACEFASLLNGMGVQVSMHYRGEHLLPGFDREAAGLLGEHLRAAGVRLTHSSEVRSIARDGNALSITNNADEVHRARHVLFATGRQANTDGLGLDAIGLSLGDKGEVPVDGRSRTALPWLHAIGDATDRLNLTPVAIDDAAAFVDSVVARNPRPVDHALVPTAVFTQPELGSVGLSEERAAERGAIEVYCTRFRPMRSAFAGDEGEALMKLSVCAETQRVLGCQIVAPGAAELIQLVAVALKMGASKRDFDRTMALHPTLAEELVTLGGPTRRRAAVESAE